VKVIGAAKASIGKRMISPRTHSPHLVKSFITFSSYDLQCGASQVGCSATRQPGAERHSIVISCVARRLVRQDLCQPSKMADHKARDEDGSCAGASWCKKIGRSKSKILHRCTLPR
jgi:hypothetical protein